MCGGKYQTTRRKLRRSLGAERSWLCSTQYAPQYFDAHCSIYGFKYSLHFEREEEHRQSEKRASPTEKKTGSLQREARNLEVFTDLDIPVETTRELFRRQAVVNAGVLFRLRNRSNGKFETQEFKYDNASSYLR
jgi:DNA gyrase subunit B